MRIDTETPTASNSTSERRLAANCANAQLSTGPRMEAGKAVSSLNAVKTGLCGRVEEHALVQALTDAHGDERRSPVWNQPCTPKHGYGASPWGSTRTRPPSVCAGTHRRKSPKPKALKNLRLHERRLQRQYEKDKAELNEMVHQRWKREERQREDEAQRRQEAAARQRRQEHAANEPDVNKRERKRPLAKNPNPPPTRMALNLQLS